jgi:excisionase family DNA binding protein
MSTAPIAHEPILAPERERKALARIEEALKPKRQTKARLLGPDGEGMIIPHSLYAVLREAVQQLSAGRGISIVPVTAELTTQQAADMLNVSRPFVIKLLEQGAIPFHMAGTHRRIYLQDVLTYKHKRDEESGKALEQLVAEAQDLGLYDE